MLELNRDTLVFSFPEVHPEAKCSIVFQRTLRIPDDDKTYPLPPGLGAFPIKSVDDHRDRVPAKWLAHGGVMLPMFQSEAMWLLFKGNRVFDHGVEYPFAVKVSTGKRSALTGEAWSNELQKKDYCVIPKQPWLDGYVVDGNTIRQFVATPLGMGFTAEEQITGKAAYGGLQIEVYPMKLEAFLRHFPKRRPELTRGFGVRGAIPMMAGRHTKSAYSLSVQSFNEENIADMGFAPGGKMKQEIYADPYSIEDWDTSKHSRCFVHIANSLVWRAITQEEPPTTPRTSKHYTNAGLPWFDYYAEGDSLQGTKMTKELKSVMQMGFQKGFHVVPENEPVEFKSDQIKKLGEKERPGIREGVWE